MTQRPTQTAQYWVETFQVTQSDIDQLYSILLERETPLTVDEMALILVRHRIKEEGDRVAMQNRAKDAYRPSNHYDVGDKLTLTQFENREGEVVATREGQNPDYGEFSVITVVADGENFDLAADFQLPHSLDEVDDAGDDEDEANLTPEDIFIEYGGEVAAALQAKLTQQDDLVRLAGRWFPKSLLAEVNLGHLNLAEAVLDMVNGGPLETEEIVEQIGIMSGFNERLAEFSLNYGLQRDERFDEVGPAGKVLWFLKRMEPPEVLTPPPRLAYTPQPYDEHLLSPELRQLEQEIGDEHTQIPVQRGRPQSVTLLLTYPHRRAGTLPLSPQLRLMFPTAYEAPRIRFVLVDGESGEEIPAWVVRPGGYVYGLTDWFKHHEVPIGGYLTIRRTEDASRVRITYAHRKSRIEWVRTAIVDNNRLRFENRKLSVGSEYDDLMIIDVEDPDALDALWKRYADRNTPLETILEELCRELIKLSPQGAVHAKTIYSAVNLVRRCPPGPIFATLVSSPKFEHVGGPYWRTAGITSGP